MPRAVPALLPPLLLVAVTLISLSAGCERAADTSTTITKLRIGVLPEDSREVVRRRFEHVRGYLETTTGIPCELRVPDSYESLLSAFLRGEIDLAYLGGYTFVAAQELVGAIPLVLRPEDRQFVSYCLVPGGSTAVSITDLEGGRLAFGSRLSTSGHLMPRHFLQEDGITPEDFFGEVVYSGAHDATALAVSAGEVDLGFANAMLVNAMFEDGRLEEGQVRILEETPPYVDYVWAASREVPEHVRVVIVDAFLALDPDREDHREILRALDASAYLPAAPHQFEAIASTVEELGMLEGLR